MAKSSDGLQGAKRFYNTVNVVAEDAGFSVQLDSRSVRTPAKARLILPTAPLAELVAREWRAQGELIRLPSMPAARLAFTAVDRIGAARNLVAADVARTAGADHLCYFAQAPRSLAERQTRLWEPVLDWARTDLGLNFQRVVGVTHRPQPAATLERIEALAAALDDFALAGLAMAAGLFGSTVLALALHRGRLEGRAAFDLSRLDEAFQEAQWGQDAEAAARTQAMQDEAIMLEQWFMALR
jgi:chaperone required for assembly of F1-ATPase